MPCVVVSICNCNCPPLDPSCFPLFSPFPAGCDVIAQHPQHNIYIRVADVSETVLLEQGTDRGQFLTTVTVYVKTIKDGNIAESIELVSEEDPTQRMSILITAKVLLGNQGNPLLKDGVHVLSHEHQDESDCTEWPGHGKDTDPED